MALLQISILGNLPETNDYISPAKMMVGSAYSFFAFWNGPELQVMNSLILRGGFAHPFVQFLYQVAARGATCHCKEAQFVVPFVHHGRGEGWLCLKYRWAMKNGAWLFRVNRGWATTEVYGDYHINHYKIIWIHFKQPVQWSVRGFFFVAQVNYLAWN